MNLSEMFSPKACNRYGSEHCRGLPFSHYVLRLHKLVLGSMGQVSNAYSVLDILLNNAFLIASYLVA